MDHTKSSSGQSDFLPSRREQRRTNRGPNRQLSPRQQQLHEIAELENQSSDSRREFKYNEGGPVAAASAPNLATQPPQHKPHARLPDDSPSYTPRPARALAARRTAARNDISHEKEVFLRTLRKYNRTKSPTSRSSLPTHQPVQPQEQQPAAWKLIRLESPSRPLTRPPRALLTTWDIRLRCYTSPRYTVPPLLSPLPRSPGDLRHQGTQTVPPTRVHKGLEVRPPTSCIETQTDSEWEAPTEEKGTQACSPSLEHQATQTEDPDSADQGTYTPPGTPPAWRKPGAWGTRQPLHRTKTQPCLGPYS
ncbi:E3 ubiquitin-protein ligase Hakai-like [Temnothorax curvispinosus]|uniref:E3 ubiquitin-protein ligase Hakai-like n=1 Tax=Temnothorax curvispinosus TaxID=300111 RepID=A0A6J1QUT7_9HYME|nr:E3 ubiquitin-protein ligase Hakai-like [Temnothorax curvispinosus]